MLTFFLGEPFLLAVTFFVAIVNEYSDLILFLNSSIVTLFYYLVTFEM